MIKVENMADELLLVSIITSDVPYQIKQKIYDAIDEYHEKRSI
jgi:hypothetical protein